MQVSISTKAVAIVGGVIVALGGIAGGVAAYNHNKAEKAKEAAALAYANRAIVENDCTMNGLGVGSCNFTNTGKTKGALCGRIVVQGAGKFEGSKFCSGQVEPMSTTKVDFTEPAVQDLCRPKRYDQSWTDMCNFHFEKDGLGGADTSAA